MFFGASGSHLREFFRNRHLGEHGLQDAIFSDSLAVCDAHHILSGKHSKRRVGVLAIVNIDHRFAELR